MIWKDNTKNVVQLEKAQFIEENLKDDLTSYALMAAEKQMEHVLRCK